MDDYWTLTRLGFAEPLFILQPHVPIIKVGRSTDNALQCKGEKISRNHMEIHRYKINDNDSKIYWRIIDHKSASHVFVNGHQILKGTFTHLNDNDLICIGGNHTIIQAQGAKKIFLYRIKAPNVWDSENVQQNESQVDSAQVTPDNTDTDESEDLFDIHLHNPKQPKEQPRIKQEKNVDTKIKSESPPYLEPLNTKIKKEILSKKDNKAEPSKKSEAVVASTSKTQKLPESLLLTSSKGHKARPLSKKFDNTTTTKQKDSNKAKNIEKGPGKKFPPQKIPKLILQKLDHPECSKTAIIKNDDEGAREWIQEDKLIENECENGDVVCIGDFSQSYEVIELDDEFENDSLMQSQNSILEKIKEEVENDEKQSDSESEIGELYESFVRKRALVIYSRILQVIHT